MRKNYNNNMLNILFLLIEIRKTGTKHIIPELAGNAKSEFVLEKVVRQVIALELLVPKGRVGKVNPVVRHVVAHISEETAREDGRGNVPVEEEEEVGQLPEGGAEDEEECRGHHEAVFVHGEVVMDTVKDKVKSNSHAIVRKIARCHVRSHFISSGGIGERKRDSLVKVEEEAVEAVFNKRPQTPSERKARNQDRQA